MVKSLLLSYLFVATILFISLAVVVKTTPYFPIDLQISKSLQTINFPRFAQAMTILSNTGWGIQLYSGIAIIILGLFLIGKKIASLFVIFISLLDTVLFFVIANLVNRPRPSPDLIRVDWKITVGGFPSGHVLLYTLIFGFLFYITLTEVKNKVLKTFLEIFFVSLMILIGIARIYSGQHWPSDVLGGYLLGSIGLIVIIYFYNRFKGPGASFFPKQNHRLVENR